MLKRKISSYLEAWRVTKSGECLLVKGARQVGKTYAVRMFGEAYESYIEVNFIEQPDLKAAFDGGLSASDIKMRLSLQIPGASFPANETLIFLDEIQECPNARTALKFLAQDDSIDVIASGSLLGISYKQQDIVSIPVGYERQVNMFGLDFEEYLWARGHSEEAVDALRRHLERMEAVPASVHDAMIATVREYMTVGGMPAVVQRFVDTLNFSDVDDVQRMIMSSYLDDIAKYAPNNLRAKARACYESIPRQLAKENTKFQYGIVEKKGTARKFDTSIDWLEEAQLVNRCKYVARPDFPLAPYEDPGRFRLYLSDVGLLVFMHGFAMKRAVVEDTLKGPMKGGIYENLVADMLVKAGVPLRYWRNDRGDREIEFLLDGDASPVPVEVKANRGASASLNAFLEDDEVKIGYKIGSMNLGKVGKKVTMPFYLAALMFAASDAHTMGGRR